MSTVPDVRRIVRSGARHVAVHRARSRISVIRGPSVGTEAIMDTALCTIGADPGVDVAIADPEVSARHLDIALGERGFLLTDLRSRSGTHVGGIRVDRMYLRPGAVVEIGASAFRFDLTGDAVLVNLHDGERMGQLVGRSVAMREAMASIARMAAADGPVLLAGEPGTEVDRAARALHGVSDRAARPFERLDCAAPAPDFDRQLFGADVTGEVREGLLDRAASGTLLLSRVEHFPLDLQPALARLLEHGTFRRVGGRRDVVARPRVVASSTASLPAAVLAGRLRGELAQRLLQRRIVLPPLRHRMEDLRMLVGAIVAEEAPQAAPVAAALLKVLAGYEWPGNHDELHDVIVGALPTRTRGERGSTPLPAVRERLETTKSLRAPPTERLSLAEARRRWTDSSEEAYLGGLLMATQHDLDEAARVAGITRRALQRLLAKHKLG